MKNTKEPNYKATVVGILTSEGNKSPITGNFSLFREIATRIASTGGKTILLTPSSLIENHLDYGYVFNHHKCKWMLTRNVAKPTIIYNRVPYRKDENTKDFHLFAQWCEENAIPFFNRKFLSKWDVYNVLSEDNRLRSYLPYTELIVSINQIEHLFHTYPSIYLKPCKGSKGNGIYILTKLNDGTYSLKTHDQTYGSTSLNNIWEKKLHPLFSNTDYLAQQHIELVKHNDLDFDFRILAHKPNKNWVVSGIGVRQRNSNGITTHVLKGGNILKLEEVASSQDIKILQQITSICGNAITKSFEDIKEFSLDIGKSVNNQFYIFEVNFKPMKFDETEIYEQGLKNLIKILNNN